MNTTNNQDAQKLASRINAMIGTESCLWCPYSHAWFTYLPQELEQIAQKIATVFQNAGMNVTIGKSATGEQLQVSAYIE